MKNIEDFIANLPENERSITGTLREIIPGNLLKINVNSGLIF